MLEIPDINPICLVGIDPGTRFLGYCRMLIHPHTYTVLGIESETIQAIQSSYYNRQLSLVHGDTVARIQCYKSELLQRFLIDRPTLIASESPFFHKLHPSSYAPLVEVVCAIREAVWNYDINLPLETIAPMVVKKAINAKSNAIKEEMTLALLNYAPYRSILPRQYITELDEHSVDAIAVVTALYRSKVLHETI